tara:strand:- start:304 stop:432 length:129 start_codon:yes stop_codon:yes gene_type:complete
LYSVPTPILERSYVQMIIIFDLLLTSVFSINHERAIDLIFGF